MIKVATKMPKLVDRFCGLLWVHLPENWKVKFLFQGETLFVSIYVSDDCDLKKIRRQYKYKSIQARKNDIWGLACDCADEIRGTILGLNNDNKEK